MDSPAHVFLYNLQVKAFCILLLESPNAKLCKFQAP